MNSLCISRSPTNPPKSSAQRSMATLTSLFPKLALTLFRQKGALRAGWLAPQRRSINVSEDGGCYRAALLTTENLVSAVDGQVRVVALAVVFGLKRVRAVTSVCGGRGAVRWDVVRCGGMRCGAMWYGAVWCGVVRCGAVRCSAVWCGGMGCGAVLCGVVRRRTRPMPHCAMAFGMTK